MALQRAGQKLGDTRVQLMREILQGIRIIKFYAWEKSFGKRVETARLEELEAVEGTAWVRAFSTVLMFSAPHFVAILAFIVYAGVEEREMTPSFVFSCLAL